MAALHHAPDTMQPHIHHSARNEPRHRGPSQPVVGATWKFAPLAVVLGALALPSAAHAESMTKPAVQRAFTDWKSGLRHEDGERVCGRMTFRYRRELLSKIAKETGVAGLGCVSLFDSYGREIYDDTRSRRLRRISIDGRRARAVTVETGDTVCFFRDADRRWRLNYASLSSTARCPRTTR